MNVLKQFLPYGIVNLEPKKLKNFLRSLLPFAVVKLIHNKNLKKRYTSKYLKLNYVSDLTEREKWTILAYIKLLEKNFKKISYLEIGIYAGGTIKFLLENTKETTFTGIDLFEDFRPEINNTHLWENYSLQVIAEALNSERVTLIKGNSIDQLKDLQLTGLKYNIIFIDGNHTYEATKQDFINALPILSNGGYLFFHNCSPGLTQEDKSYLLKDGGPWMLTEELKNDNRLHLEYEADRLRVFKLK